MKAIREIQYNGLLWINVADQREKELREIQKRFHFMEQDIKESLPPYQRPKIVKRPDYYFMVLHFPVFDRETRRLGFTEIDFFLSGSFLVTVHDNKLAAMEHFFKECQHGDKRREEYFSGTAVHIFFELLSRLLDAIFPSLLHINEDIDSMDKKLFVRLPGEGMAEEILRLKTNIVTFRRTMQGHRSVLERLIMCGGHELDIVSYQGYINSLREFSNEIWNTLESQKESINALHEANESLSALRTNQVMKFLAVISFITLPLSILSVVFATEADGNFFLIMPYGFWAILASMIIGAAVFVWVFKKKKWL